MRRSRSQRSTAAQRKDKGGSVTDHHHGEETVEKGCSWDNLPQESLREVLIKVEASESKWQNRKNVVACAGVCRTWRKITKDIVKLKLEEFSGQLTFPISVKQHGPRDFLLRCFVKQNRSPRKYYLYLGLTNGENFRFNVMWLHCFRSCSC